MPKKMVIAALAWAGATLVRQVNNNGTSALILDGATTSVVPRNIGDDPKALAVGMRHNV